MSVKSQGWGARPVAALLVFLLAGCHYVKQDDYDAAIGELRNNDAGLRRDVDANKADLASLRSELDARFQKYDAAISQLQGRVRVDLVSHFDFGKAALRDEDKPALDDFAAVLREHRQGVVVAVEGFADAAGPAPYNKRLAQKRAEVVRGYLIEHGGLPSSQLRAVSYGKDRNRQVAPGAWGKKGEANRRVVLAIDDAGAAAQGPAAGSP